MKWSALSAKTRIYIILVVSLAIPLFSRAFRDVFWGGAGFWGGGNYWLVLSAITLITVPIFVSLPSVSTTVGIGDAFVISISMLYGPSPAILANTFYTSFQCLLLRRRYKVIFYRITFNIAVAVINVWLYSLVFQTLRSQESNSIENVIIPTFAVAVSFFLSNSLLTATAISLSNNSNIFQFWVSNYRSLILDFLVSTSAGAFIWIFGGINAYIPLLVAPFVGAVWGINKINRAKTIEAEKHLRDQEGLYLRTVESLALAVDAKDQTTYGHIRRVRAYAMGLAKLSGITDPMELMAIETGSLLHDIGKLAIDDYILNKPGRLTKQEFEKMKMHAPAGDEILRQIQFPFPVARYVRFHHERWDGSGYPDGLRAEEIPFGARILAIADAFDAIRSSRPYKMSFGIEDSVELLRAQAGTVYDPDLVEIFVKNINFLEARAVDAAKDIPELTFRKYFENVDKDLAKPGTIPDLAPHSSEITTELLLLSEFSSSIARHLRLQEILSILAIRLKRILPFSTGAIFLDTGNNCVRASHSFGKYSESLEGLTLGLGKGISGWVAAYKKPMLNTGPALEFQGLTKDFSRLTDTLVVPIVYQDTCLGTISLYAEAPVFFSQTHLALLQIVAKQFGSVINGAMQLAALAKSDDTSDPVTGLRMLPFLTIAGENLLSQASFNHSPVSLLLLSITNLSELIHSFGSNSCELALKRLTQILKTEIRETDVLVRFGYNGFVALLSGIRRDQSHHFAERLVQQVSMSPVVSVGGNSIFVSCRSGIATFPDDGTTIQDLLEFSQNKIFESTIGEMADQSQEDTNVIGFPPRGN